MATTWFAEHRQGGAAQNERRYTIMTYIHLRRTPLRERGSILALERGQIDVDESARPGTSGRAAPGE